MMPNMLAIGYQNKAQKDTNTKLGMREGAIQPISPNHNKNIQDINTHPSSTVHLHSLCVYHSGVWTAFA